jgi:hypothetical protein
MSELKDLKFDVNHIYGARNTDEASLSLGCFGGRASMVVFKKGSKQPDIKLTLDVGFTLELIKRLEAGIAASKDETFRKPLVRCRYDRDTKQYIPDVTVVVCKEAGMMSIEISGNGCSAKFPLRTATVISNGEATMGKEQRSILGAQELIVVLKDYLPTATLLSRFNPPPRNPGNNQQNRNTNNSNPDTNYQDDSLAF